MFYKKLKKRAATLELEKKVDAKKIADLTESLETVNRWHEADVKELTRKLNAAETSIQQYIQQLTDSESNVTELKKMLSESTAEIERMSAAAIVQEGNIAARDNNIGVLTRNQKMLRGRIEALREMNLAAETRLSIFKDIAPTCKTKTLLEKNKGKSKKKVASKKIIKKTAKNGSAHPDDIVIKGAKKSAKKLTKMAKPLISMAKKIKKTINKQEANNEAHRKE